MTRAALYLKWLSYAVAMSLLVGCSAHELRETIFPLGPQEAVITLDPSHRYQTITGWEATAQAGQDFRSFPTYRDKLVSEAVTQLGLNRLRVELKSGVENTVDYSGMRRSGSITSGEFRNRRYEIVNDNDDPFLINESGFQFSELDFTIDELVIPMRRLLGHSGQKMFVNLNYVDFGSSDFEHKNDPEEYAEFILAAFLHMRDKYGFVPDSVEVILEPDTDTADWTATQIAQAVVAAARRLRANGFDPQFVAPSTTNAANAVKYIDEMATVPGSIETIAEFSYHRYSDATKEVLQKIGDRGRLYGKQTSMLEWIGADQNTLHQDLTLANVSAWQQYTLAYSGEDNGGAYYKVDSEEASANIRMGEISRHLSQYFRYVRPGSVRIGASTSNERLDAVAFVNPGGGTVVVVNATAAGSVAISNLPAGRYAVTRATTSKENSNQSYYLEHSGSEHVTVVISERGVVTISHEGR